MSLLAASGAAAMSAQSPDRLRTVDKGAQSNIESPRQAVARTADEWRALWRLHDPNKPVPPVDFAREMVVAVFIGSRPTAGYSVEITSVEPRGGAIVVSYRETGPPRDAITAQVLTSPYDIVAAPNQIGDVRFEKQSGRNE